MKEGNFIANTGKKIFGVQMLLISYVFLFTLKTSAYYTVYIHIIKTQSESYISL